MVKRLAGILLLANLLALGCGWLEYAHNLQHLRQQQWLDEIRNPHHIPPADKPLPLEQNCWVHMQLHLPLIAASTIQLLVLAGVLIAFLSQIVPVRPAYQVLLRIDCRGPPR